MNKDVILIFGGDGKIAQAVVQKYLDNNCIVIAVDIAEKSRNNNFYTNPDYYYYSSDVTNIAQLQSLYKKLENTFSKIDHIISGVGVPSPTDGKGIFEIEFEDIDKSIKLNLSSHLYISKIFLPLLRKSTANNKSLILVSSINSLKPLGMPAYSAAKAGIYGLMNCIVRDLGKEHIRINTISPGTVASHEEVEMKEKFWGYTYKDMMALKTFTFPEDIADAMFSLTHITKSITGQNIIVDSGQIT